MVSSMHVNIYSQNGKQKSHIFLQFLICTPSLMLRLMHNSVCTEDGHV